MNNKEEFVLLLNVYNCFVKWTNRNFEHSQLLDDDDDDNEGDVEEKEGGWVEDGQWWWWPREEEEEIVDDCCLPINSTGIGSAKASLTFGNWPQDLDQNKKV